jgi:hypothetical protein
MPPAVALLYYMRSGRLLRIFPKLGLFAGFSLYIINFAGRNSEVAMGGAGDIIYFRAQRSSFRVQHSSLRVLRRSEGCSVTQKGAA